MKVFIAQRVSGEDMNILREESCKIVSSLKKAGCESYCTISKNLKAFNKKSKREVMEHAFAEIDNCDVLLVILRDETKSEDLLMEVGYTLGKKKKIVLAILPEIKNTYLRKIADKVIEFKNISDLCSKLNKLKI